MPDRSMKLPTKLVRQIDYAAVYAELLTGTQIYHCTHDEGKAINAYVRQTLKRGLSMKAHEHDIDGNVLSYRFVLHDSVKKRTSHEVTAPTR